MPRLKVVRRIRYAGKQYHAGQTMEVDDLDHLPVLLATRKVREMRQPRVEAEKPAAVKPATRKPASAPGRQYTRRDMVPDESSK